VSAIFGEPLRSFSPMIMANEIIKGWGMNSSTARVTLRVSVVSVGTHVSVGC
jgi:hypothetical protein